MDEEGFVDFGELLVKLRMIVRSISCTMERPGRPLQEFSGRVRA
jgi:hypothetical protein